MNILQPKVRRDLKSQQVLNFVKNIIVIILLIFFYPVGLISMWFWTKWPKWLKLSVTILLILIQLTALTFGYIYFRIAQPFRVVGSAMNPTLTSGQKFFVNKTVYKNNLPQRGDIVVLKDPKNANRVLIKRIIGLPREQIQIKSGQVYINNQVLVENYLPSGTQTEAGTFLQEDTIYTIPENQYVVLGDNRNQGVDSRESGYIYREDIIGKYWFKY